MNNIKNYYTEDLKQKLVDLCTCKLEDFKEEIKNLQKIYLDYVVELYDANIPFISFKGLEVIIPQLSKAAEDISSHKQLRSFQAIIESLLFLISTTESIDGKTDLNTLHIVNLNLLLIDTYLPDDCSHKWFKSSDFSSEKWIQDLIY